MIWKVGLTFFVGVCFSFVFSLSCSSLRFVSCVWQDLYLGQYPGVNDSWMDVISSQGSSLLSVDLSGSEVTDTGLLHLKDCTNLLALNFDYCDQISDRGLEPISGSLFYACSITMLLLVIYYFQLIIKFLFK